MRSALPFLLLLACPLMMFACMRGMRGHGSEKTEQHADGEAAQLREEVAALREELSRRNARENAGRS